jgi:hypothetical protein
VPIDGIVLQRRQVEVGRIRIGQQVNGSRGKRPEKLDRFRFTSASKTLIDIVAGRYGGEARPWQPPAGAAQYEVITTATSLPVLVPPNPVSQWYESWNAGGCVRRCDGVREVLSEQPCMCDPNPGRRQCKPTTRISLMLAEIPGIGAWRLETRGWYAATELPAAAELLAMAGGYIPGRLELQQRTRKVLVDGKSETRHWMVPVLHVDVAPMALLEAGGQVAALGRGQAAVEGGGPQAIAAAPAGNGADVGPWLDRIDTAPDRAALASLWEQCPAPLRSGALRAAFERRGAELADVPPTVDGDAVVGAVVEEVPVGDPKVLWNEIVAASPWPSTSELERRFKDHQGVAIIDADARQLAAFLTALKNGEVR